MNWAEKHRQLDARLKDDHRKRWRKFKVDSEFIPTILRRHRAVGVPLNTQTPHKQLSASIAIAGPLHIANENQSLYTRAAVTNVRTSGVKLMAAGIVEIRSQSVIRRSAGDAHERTDKRHEPRWQTLM